MLKTLLSQVKQYKRSSILALVCTSLEVVTQLLLPVVIAAIIDKGIAAGNLNQVYLYGIIMLILAFTSLALGVLAGRFASGAASGFAANLRDAMYRNVQTFSFSNIDKFSTAGLVTRMTTDVTNLQMTYMQCLRIVVRAPLMLIFSMVMCFLISVRISLMFLAAIVILGIGLLVIMHLTVPVFNRVFRKYDDLNASVEENVSAIRVVKAFVREKLETGKFKKASDGLYDLSVTAEKILAFNNPLMLLIIYGCILGISWIGAHYIVVGTLTTGELFSLFSYVMFALTSLMTLSMVIVMLTMSIASAERISEVLVEAPDLTNPEQALDTVADGSIDFDHVSFSYQSGSGEKVLKDISFHIDAGQTIGIIGGTGSGKSSLVSLISRLYDVDEGNVRVGGKDVRRYDMDVLRNQVAVVLQKNVLFSGTILDNLRWGKENATEEECQESWRVTLPLMMWTLAMRRAKPSCTTSSCMPRRGRKSPLSALPARARLPLPT